MVALAPPGMAASDLTEIPVSGRMDRLAAGRPPDALDDSAIKALAPISLDDVLRAVPGLNLQTNSRGETLVFVRNAGERQVATFFEGAPLNIPWDNRINLGLLPASALGSVEVLKGVIPSEFGANISGGAVIASGLSVRGGPLVQLQSKAGTAGLVAGDGVFIAGDDRRGLRLGLGYARHGDVPLPDSARLPFNQLSDNRRTNSAREFLSADARFETRIGETMETGLSILAIDANFDVPVEGTIDPAIDRPRFWRQPQWRLLMGIGSLAGGDTDGLAWKSVLWTQSFAQTIDSFSSIAFDDLAAKQEDDDLSIGGRLLLDQSFDFGTLGFSLNAMTSTHRQRDSKAGEAGLIADPRLRFRERVISTAIDWTGKLPEAVEFNLSVGLDWKATPQTGDKPDSGDFVVWSATAGISARPGDTLLLSADIGRRARLPTMRELFGEALNRFLINPDLRAEGSWIAEIGVSYETDVFHLSATPFLTLTEDSIDQRNLVMDGRRLRQRINLRGSHVAGIEVAGSITLPLGFEASGHLTASRAVRRPSSDDDFRALPEKPDLVAGASLTWRRDGMMAQIDLRHLGGAVTIDGNDIPVPLERSTGLDLMLMQDIAPLLGLGGRLDLYFKLRNLTDTAVEPQLGLPEAGRWLSFGLTFSSG